MGQSTSRQKKRDRRKFQDERKHQNTYNTYATEDIDFRDYRDKRHNGQNWQIRDCRAAQVTGKAQEGTAKVKTIASVEVTKFQHEMKHQNIYNKYATEDIDFRDYRGNRHNRQNWQIRDSRAAQVTRKAKEGTAKVKTLASVEVAKFQDERKHQNTYNTYATEDIDFRDFRDNRHNGQNWQIRDCRAAQVTGKAKEGTAKVKTIASVEVAKFQDERKHQNIYNTYATEDIDFRDYRDNRHNGQNWQIRDCRAAQVTGKAQEGTAKVKTIASVEVAKFQAEMKHQNIYHTFATEDIDFRDYRDNRHNRQNWQIRDCRAAQVTGKAKEGTAKVKTIASVEVAKFQDERKHQNTYNTYATEDIDFRDYRDNRHNRQNWQIRDCRAAQVTRKAKEDFQTDLVRYYRECHSKISVSPLIMDNDVPIEKFYVQPPMEAIDLQRRFGNPAKTPVTSYKQLFFRDDNSTFKNIYVTADAGVGKTAFTRKICTTWCQAYCPITSLASKYDDGDILAAQYFEFLFLIPLRDADGSLCDVDKLIESLVKENLPRRHNRETLAQILEESTCLVILDGLDEWCHSESCSRRHHEHDIPHRKRRPNWTILITTRPWKFDVLRLASFDVDRHMEIKELDEESSEQLVSNAVSLLNEQLADDLPKKSVEEFYQTTSSMKLGEIRQVPYIYLQSVCLWFEGNDIGGSKCAIYTNVLELTLKRGIQKIKPMSKRLPQEEEIRKSVPKCMMEKEYCVQHLTLLLKLGKLAFYTLFGTENRQLLVFDVRIATKYLTSQELDYYLKLGILSQNKGYGSVATKISNISFQHKSLHEYFSALYMQSNDIKSSDRDPNIQDLVDKTCTTLPSILEMSIVFIFLSGFRPTVYSDISHKMRKYVTLDKHTIKYRKTLSYVIDEPESEVIHQFQTLQVDCLQEMLANEHDVHRLPIEDIVIDEDSKHAESVSVLQKLVHQNSVHLKSLSIAACENTKEAINIIEALDIQYLHSLAKLELAAVVRQPVVEQLLRQSKTTLQYLRLNFVSYEQGVYINEMTVLSDVCEEMVLGMPLLQGLRLGGLIVTHDQLEKVTNFLTSRVTMTVISMDIITCSDHNESCPGVQFNLSEHDNLQMLGLYNVPVSQLQVNKHHLEECVIGGLPSCVVTSCLTSLTTAHNFHKLYCNALSDHDMTSLITTLPALLQLEKLYILSTDLTDRSLSLTTDLTRLRYIQLDRVLMTSSDLRALSCSVCTLSQSVSVALFDCTVTTEIEYKTVKEEIRESDHFTDIFDGHNGYCQEFSFNTVK